MNKKLMSRFSEWLKTNRKLSGLTLMQLKSAIGDLCSDAYLSQLENDRYKGKKGNPKKPDKTIVIALARVFNADVDKVLELTDYAPTNQLPAELNAIGFNELSKEDLEKIASYIQFLKSQKGAKE